LLSIFLASDDYMVISPEHDFVQLDTKRGEPMKFIFLGYYEPSIHASMTEDERNAMFDEAFEYDDHLRANGHFHAGEAVQPAETALTVYWKNGKVATTDGPYAETKEQLGGIGVFEARDMDHAVELMSHHPTLRHGAVFDIRPAFDMSELMQKSEQRRGKVVAR
jgi:hypothetical protein